MKTINQQIIERIRPLVINQLGYVTPTCGDRNMDARIDIFEALSDEQRVALLGDGTLLSDDSLLELAERIGVADLYDVDADIWGCITDYIHQHDAQCQPLWNHISNMLDDSSCIE